MFGEYSKNNFTNNQNLPSSPCDPNKKQGSIEQTKEGTLKTQSTAIETFLILSLDLTNGDLVREAGGISKIVKLLESDSSNIQEKALDALQNLACNITNQDTIREAGEIPKIVELLESDSPSIQEKALATLQNLAFNQVNRDAIRETKGIQKIVKLLESDSLHIQEQALNTLGNLLYANIANKDAIREAEGIPKLVKLLESNSPNIQEKTLVILKSLACSTNNKDVIREAGGIPKIIKFLESNSPDIQKKTLITLQNLACNAINQDAIREAGGIPKIIKFLESDSPDIQEKTLIILQNLSCNIANRDAIRESGGIPKLVKLLESNSLNIQEKTLVILRNLSPNTTNRDALQKVEGISKIVKFLKSNSPDTQEDTIYILLLSVSNDVHKEAILKAGALPLLAKQFDTILLGGGATPFQKSNFLNLLIKLASDRDLGDRDLLFKAKQTLDVDTFSFFLNQNIDSKEWDLIASIYQQLPPEKRTKVEASIGMDLPKYLKLNSEFPSTSGLFTELNANLDSQPWQQLVFENLMADQREVEYLEKDLGDYFDFPKDAFWKLSIDFHRQESKMCFDQDEPGYLAGMMNGWRQVKQNLEANAPLTFDLFVDLHDKAITYKSTEHNRYGRVKNLETNHLFLLGVDFSNLWDFPSKSGDYAAREEKEKLKQAGLIQEMESEGKTTTSGVYSNYIELKEKLNTVLDTYHEKISSAQTEQSKLLAIAELCRTLELMHIFPDGNQRTISFLLLNQELRRYKLNLCMLEDPTCFDGHYSLNDLVISIRKGQEEVGKYRSLE